MDTADLRVFRCVARCGSLNKAALELNTVQSNVTARIKALEDEMGNGPIRSSSGIAKPSCRARFGRSWTSPGRA
jgi:hypothetical protein